MVGKTRDDVVAGRFPAPAACDGFEGPAADLMWLGLPLRERQDRALLEAGLSSQGEGAHLLVRDDVAVTADAITAFLEAAQARGLPARWAAGGRSGTLAQELALGDEGPWLVWLPAGTDVTDEHIASAQPVEVDPRERLLHIPVAAAGADLLEVPVSDRLVLPTSHWVQSLWANLLGLGPFLWRGLAGRNIVEVAWRAVFAAIRAGSVDPRRVGARLGRRGRGCRVHPSAVVEGCWLGDGVEIGAHAIVRASVLADGAAVEDLALVEASVLGRGARVQRQAMVKYSVLQDRAMAAGTMQLGVLDVDAALKWGAALMDQAFQRSVRVKVGDRIVPAPAGLAGGCVGARSVVGAGVFVAPGRAIPPDLFVIAPPQVVVHTIPDALRGTVTVRGGRLEPV